MPDTGASIGYGTLYEASIDGGTTWTALAEVFNMTPPAASVDVHDATHMQSPDATREFIAGLIDPGELSLEMNFIPGSSGDVYIQARRAARVKFKSRITFPNAVKWTFNTFVTNYESAVPNDDKMTSTMTCKVTGSSVSTPAAAPINTTLPAIAGLPKVGVVLTALHGVWTGAPTYSYQWKKAGVDIVGATAQTYTPVVGDIGGTLTVVVTGTNAAGNASATSTGAIAVVA